MDSRNHELRKRGRKIRLQDQPFELLETLLQRPGEVVTREELHQKLWPADTFVDFNHGINNAMNRLREVLSDSSNVPSFIETIPRRGYRFIALVRAEDQTVVAAAGEYLPAARGKRRTAVTILVFVVLLAAFAAAWFALQHPGERPIDSMAVLPLTNLVPQGGDDYVAEGMTEELITGLGRMSSFRVISRTSVMRYKNTAFPVPEIARELGVDALIEGTVRRSGDRVRITVQLIRVSPERHIWAEAYEGDIRDVLTLQRDVARDIVGKIQTKVVVPPAASLRVERRLDPETHEDYLRGRYFLAKRSADGMNTAREYFHRAVARDPGYAQAYAGLADSYDLLAAYEILPPEEGFRKAKEFAGKALQLDGTLSEAYTARAAAESFWDFDWSSAEQDFVRAIALDPNSAIAHHWYGEHSINIAKPARAVSELKRARELDPLSLPINGTLGRVYRDAHLYAEALQQCRRTLELDPNFAMGHWCLSQVYIAERRYPEAISELELVSALGATPLMTADLGFAYAAAGNTKKAKAILEALASKANSAYVAPYSIAGIYGALGQKDEAFKWLEIAYAERDSIAYLALDPKMNPLRADPRFPPLIERLHLPK